MFLYIPSSDSKAQKFFNKLRSVVNNKVNLIKFEETMGLRKQSEYLVFCHTKIKITYCNHADCVIICKDFGVDALVVIAKIQDKIFLLTAGLYLAQLYGCNLYSVTNNVMFPA